MGLTTTTPVNDNTEVLELKDYGMLQLRAPQTGSVSWRSGSRKFAMIRLFIGVLSDSEGTPQW